MRFRTLSPFVRAPALLADCSVTHSGRLVVSSRPTTPTWKSDSEFSPDGGGVFYIEEVATKQQHSLRTRNRAEAEQLVQAKNMAVQQSLLNRALGKTYLGASDPKMLSRRWRDVFEVFCSRGRDSSQERSRRAAASRCFDLLREKPLIETTAEDFLEVLKLGGAATHNYLRRFHNLALDCGWLLAPILPRKAWPPVQSIGKRRAVTREEYERIVTAEQNTERRRYYELLWETGAAQTDAAMLRADNVDWRQMVLVYERKKLRTGSDPCQLQIGQTLAALLRSLPQVGFFFPSIVHTDPRHRSAEFSRRCRLLGISGISLHSFRYAWAQRACEIGYPERYAQAALGHSSKAVHRAYSRRARMLCPSLETFAAACENRIIPLPPQNLGSPSRTDYDLGRRI